MTLGVVIPTYNEEQALPRTLSSLDHLHCQEVVIVDGGSQDHTVFIAAAHGRHATTTKAQTLFSSKGRAHQMNVGAAAVQSDVVMFLHSDTLLPHDARWAIEQAMANESCVGGRFDVTFEEDYGYAWLISRMMNFRSRLTGIATGDQAIFVRKSVFDQLGGFADIPLMEDIEFTRRLKHMGHIAALRTKVTTSFRRWKRHGPLRTIGLMWTLRFLFWLGLNPRTLHQFYGTVR